MSQMNAQELKNEIIIPVLNNLNLYSESAVNLLLGTCAQESYLGKYVKQINGPALGIYQMEPKTHDDIWENFLAYHRDLANEIKGSYGYQAEDLESNPFYATAMTRIFYYRIKEELPCADNIDSLAAYWKRYYNTPLGRGQVSEFIRNYNRLVANAD